MSISLYDVSVGSFNQTLGAVTGFLDKGRAHCEASAIDLNDIVETRLYPDMLPFRFQLVSVAHHSLGALKGVQEGLFTPPPRSPDLDYDALEKLVSEARSGLQQLSRESVNALVGNEVEFKLRDRSMYFAAEDFLMTFSLPNFYFHATTAYDILRLKGVPVGKRDFLGQLRLKA